MFHRESILEAWDGEKIDQMMELVNEKKLEVVNVSEHGRPGRNDSLNECQSMDQVMIPLKAKSTKGSWKVIVNLENKLRQEIMISKCKYVTSIA